MLVQTQVGRLGVSAKSVWRHQAQLSNKNLSTLQENSNGEIMIEMCLFIVGLFAFGIATYDLSGGVVPTKTQWVGYALQITSGLIFITIALCVWLWR